MSIPDNLPIRDIDLTATDKDRMRETDRQSQFNQKSRAGHLEETFSAGPQMETPMDR